MSLAIVLDVVVAGLQIMRRALVNCMNDESYISAAAARNMNIDKAEKTGK